MPTERKRLSREQVQISPEALRLFSAWKAESNRERAVEIERQLHRAMQLRPWDLALFEGPMLEGHRGDRAYSEGHERFLALEAALEGRR